MATVDVVAVQVADATTWLDALPGVVVGERKVGNRSVTERDATVLQPLRNVFTAGQWPSALWWTWREQDGTAVSVRAENVPEKELTALITSLEWVKPAEWSRYQR